MATLICAATNVPGAFLHDKKKAILAVHGPKHHARLIYPEVRALLMRYDVVGTDPSHSTIRTATHQSGTGDFTLAHVLAGVSDPDELAHAQRYDDGHLQGVLHLPAPPPPEALRCPQSARQYIYDEHHIELQDDPTLEWAADPSEPLPWPSVRSPAATEPPPGTSAHAEERPPRGSVGTDPGAAYAGPAGSAAGARPAHARLDDDDAASGGDAARTLADAIEAFPAPDVPLGPPVVLLVTHWNVRGDRELSVRPGWVLYRSPHLDAVSPGGHYLPWGHVITAQRCTDIQGDIQW